MLYVGDEDDTFCFDGVDNWHAWNRESLIAELMFVPPDVNYDLYLYRNQEDCQSGTVMAAGENVAHGGAERIELNEGTFGGGLGDSRYFVRVRRIGGVACTTQYRLRVTGLQYVD